MESHDQAILELKDKLDDQMPKSLKKAHVLVPSDNVQSPGLNGSVQDLDEIRRGMRELKSLVMSSAKGSFLSTNIFFTCQKTITLLLKFQEIAMNISLLVDWPNQDFISSIPMDHPMEQIHFMLYVIKIQVLKINQKSTSGLGDCYHFQDRLLSTTTRPMGKTSPTVQTQTASTHPTRMDH